MAFHYTYGRLAYQRLSTGEERGREDWWLTRNRDGSRTLRCLAMTDDSRFVRDAIFTLGADSRPRDVLLHLQVDDRRVGTGLFHLDGDRLHVATHAADSGSTQQIVRVPPRVHIVTHAVMHDAWPFWQFDEEAAKERGDTEQRVPIYNTSTRWNGTDGPLGRMEELIVAARGSESITVPAGTFDCQRFTLDIDDPSIPTSHVWITGPDKLLVRYDWPDFDLTYRLVRLVKA